MKPNLVTDVEVGGATTADNTYVESGVKGTEDVTLQVDSLILFYSLNNFSSYVFNGKINEQD